MDGDGVAWPGKEKTEVLKAEFATAYSFANFGEDRMKRRQAVLGHRGNGLRLAVWIAKLNCTGHSPGQDLVCYIMLKHVSDVALCKVLDIFNTI